MNVFLFPGQGSQEIGMASDLFKTDAAFRSLVSQASDLVGCDLEKLCLRGPERELIRPKYLQPLLVCVSLGYLRHLQERGIVVHQTLGHSLGEISALAAAGIVSVENAVAIAVRRGELMEQIAARVPGGMVAVISHDGEAVRHLASHESLLGSVVLAIDNASGQLVFSGPVPALEQFTKLVSVEKLGHCKRLAVHGPWHHPLMEPARLEFVRWLESMEFQPPKISVFFNVTGRIETDPVEIRRLVGRNLVEPVQWRFAMGTLSSVANLTFFEVGPGRVLSGLVRANGFGDATRIFNINNLRGIESAASFC